MAAGLVDQIRGGLPRESLVPHRVSGEGSLARNLPRNSEQGESLGQNLRHKRPPTGRILSDDDKWPPVGPGRCSTVNPEVAGSSPVEPANSITG